jgi:tetratricopeptide (TPR) repeat protein
MKLSIPLKDIMLAPGRQFDPASSSEREVIERVRKIYGVIAAVMDIAVRDGMVEIEFKDATPEKFGEAMKKLAKGVDEAGKGRLPEALKLFQEVLAVIPENVAARRNMAKVYREQGKLEKAKQHLQECLQIDPTDAWSYVMLGNIYSHNESNLEVAAFYYEKCLEHHPKDAIVLTNYAGLMTERGEFQKAEILFKKAINIQDVPNAYYGLALIYRMAGQLDAARQVLETFFTRTVNMKGVEGSPIQKEAKNLYRELSAALDVPKQSH